VLPDDFIPCGIRTWTSSTIKGGSEQSFLTIGTLACCKWPAPDDGGGGHYRNMSDFINIKSCFKHSFANCWYSSIVANSAQGEQQYKDLCNKLHCISPTILKFIYFLTIQIPHLQHCLSNLETK